jgi:hypothetical protein
MGCIKSKPLDTPNVAIDSGSGTDVNDVVVDVNAITSVLDIVNAANGGKLGGKLDLSQIGLEDAEDGYKPPIVEHELYMDEVLKDMHVSLISVDRSFGFELVFFLSLDPSGSLSVHRHHNVSC